MPLDDSDIEQTLLRYHPVAPPTSLREKILTPSPLAAPPRPTPRWPLYLFRAAIAATLLISFPLLHFADPLNQATVARAGLRPTLWTADAEQTAALLDAGPAGRRYLAFCLA